jgi:TetR/AcrR family transcriptional regulator, regulator of cefoperazone and chloramphenicol sensitivity
LKQVFGAELMMEVQDTTKVRLLEAAGEEFACKGFDAARIRTICERAGANVAAVNYHFGDKEQLYVQAVLVAHRCGFEGEDEVPADPLAPAEQLRGFIHHFLARVLSINDPDDWRHRLMLREMLHPTTASDVLIREAIRPKFERLSGILRSFCPGADERRIHALAFSVIGQCLHYKMARPVAERLIGPEAFAALDLDYLTDHITSFCLAALGGRPPLNQEGEPVANRVKAAP